MRARTKIIGLDKLRGQFNILFNHKLPRQLSRAVKTSAMNIQKNAIIKAPSGIGGILKASINASYSSNKLNAVVGSTLDYAKFMEYGTALYGKQTNKQALPEGYIHGSKHSPSSRHLLLWVTRKFGVKGSKAKWLAYKVARAIAGQGKSKQHPPGLRARPFLGPAFDIEEPKFLRRVRAVLPEARPAAAPRQTCVPVERLPALVLLS